MQNPSSTINRSDVFSRGSTIYHIPFEYILEGYINKSILKQVKKFESNKNFQTTIYKCKLPFLSQYNYHLAIQFQIIINQLQNFAGMVQVMPLKQTRKIDLEKYQKDQYQILYRFEVYQEEQHKISDYVFTVQPLEYFLDKHISLPCLPQKNQANLTDFSRKIKSQTFQSKRESTIVDRIQNKFSFCVSNNQLEDLQFLMVYEINLTLNEFLKKYHLQDDVQDLKIKFKYLMQVILSKYDVRYQQQRQ